MSFTLLITDIAKNISTIKKIDRDQEIRKCLNLLII